MGADLDSLRHHSQFLISNFSIFIFQFLIPHSSFLVLVTANFRAGVEVKKTKDILHLSLTIKKILRDFAHSTMLA